MQKKHGRLYIRTNRILAKYSLLVQTITKTDNNNTLLHCHLPVSNSCSFGSPSDRTSVYLCSLQVASRYSSCHKCSLVQYNVVLHTECVGYGVHTLNQELFTNIKFHKLGSNLIYRQKISRRKIPRVSPQIVYTYTLEHVQKYVHLRQKNS